MQQTISPPRRLFFPELPLFRRETAALLRSPRALYGLILAVLVSAALPLLYWPKAGSAEAWAAQNRTTILMFLFAQLGAALLAVVASASQSIVGERTRDSLDVLRSSLFSPHGIIVSKVCASTAYVLFILGATLPVACLLYLWGGVSFASLLRCEAMTLAAVLLAAFVAVDQSASARQPGTAALRALAAVLAWTLIPITHLFPLMLAARFSASLGLKRRNDPSRPSFIVYFLFVGVFGAVFSLLLGGTTVAPFPILSEELGLGRNLARAGLGADWKWLGYMVLSAMSSLLLLHSAARVLEMPGRDAETAPPTPSRWSRRPLLPKLRPKEPARSAAASARPLHSRRARMPTPARKPHEPVGAARRSLFTESVLAWGRQERGPLSNPVFRREIRGELHGSALYWGGIFVATTFGGVIAGFATSEGRSLSRGIAFLGLAIASLVVPPIAAASFPREREGGSFDLLASTPLSAGTLVAGKFLSMLHAVSPVAMACLLVLVAFSPVAVPGLAEHGFAFLYHSLWDLFLVLLVALSAVSFNIALSLFVSVRSSRILPAMGFAYMAFLAIQVLPAFAGWLILSPEWALRVLPAVNPLLAISNHRGGPHEILCAALHAAGTFIALRAASAALEKRLRAP